MGRTAQRKGGNVQVRRTTRVRSSRLQKKERSSVQEDGYLKVMRAQRLAIEP